MSIFDRLSVEARAEISKLSADVKSELHSVIEIEHGLIETFHTKWPLLVIVFVLGGLFGHWV